jgi:hypothetical protein
MPSGFAEFSAKKEADSAVREKLPGGHGVRKLN